jgi:Glycosyl transferase family 8
LPDLEVVYAAFGESYVRQAAISAWSVKRHMPGARVSIVTDREFECRHFDDIALVAPAPPDASTARFAKGHKVQAVLRSRAECVLYLDADTYVMSDLSDVTQALAGYDLAAAHDTYRFEQEYQRLHPTMRLQSFPPWHPFFNCGVLFVRRSSLVDAFLERWRDEFLSDSRILLDQLVFRRLLYDSDLRVRTLPSEYNVRPGVVQMSGRVHLLHTRASTEEWRWSLPLLGDFLNSATGNRVYTPHDEKLVLQTENYEFLERKLADHVPISEREEFLRPEITFASTGGEPVSLLSPEV